MCVQYVCVNCRLGWSERAPRCVNFRLVQLNDTAFVTLYELLSADVSSPSRPELDACAPTSSDLVFEHLLVPSAPSEHICLNAAL